MKKLALILGVVVMGVIMSSCTNKKEAAISAFNAFFDNEVTALKAVDNADAMLDYLKASDSRFEEFFAKMNKDFPLDENENIIGLNQTDSDAAMKVYDDRLNAWAELRNTKGGEFYEGYIAKLESIVNGLADDLVNEKEPAADIDEQILAAYDNTDKYVELSTDEQYERYTEIDQLVKVIFGIEEEETAE
ncbi:MAG: hypothetical protein IKM95_03680 [Bacteroidales bacterium]|nr:hypothetical protein [Bacteroidales bacterium]